MKTAGKFWLSALMAATAGVSAHAQAQELSDKSVSTIMDYAWSLVPAQFSQPDGKVIITDKKNIKASLVPIEVAKEVIRVARISAHAQICNMPEDQKANHRTLMGREEAKKTWSPQQMLYINQIHLVTVMLMTGNVKVTDKADGNKEVSIEADKGSAKTCSEEEKSKVKGLIEAYVKADAGAAPVAAAAAPEKK